MSIFQTGIIVFFFFLYGALILLFFKAFTKSRQLSSLLITPILVFSIGFLMRLSERKEIVDAGFFLTESSVLFVSVIFTGALILGQLKYWKK